MVEMRHFSAGFIYFELGSILYVYTVEIDYTGAGLRNCDNSGARVSNPAGYRELCTKTANDFRRCVNSGYNIVAFSEVLL